VIGLESASDPGAWSWFGSLNTNATIVLVALIPQLTILLIWRGSEKLGIIGIGTTMKADLNYVVALLEHVIGKPPSREDERVSRTNEAKVAPRASRP
jgi:hypothetical protein